MPTSGTKVLIQWVSGGLMWSISPWFIVTLQALGNHKLRTCVWSRWITCLCLLQDHTLVVSRPTTCIVTVYHDDVIKWKHFLRYWSFVRGIHRSPVNSPHKGRWRGSLVFSLICAWINGWVNHREAGDLSVWCNISISPNIKLTTFVYINIDVYVITSTGNAEWINMIYIQACVALARTLVMRIPTRA